MAEDRAKRRATGAGGETAVQAHLKRLGWEILAVNFRCAYGEMDLIARETQQGEAIFVFVEVKTRRGATHGRPIEAVAPRKQRRLISIAQAFLAEQGVGGMEPACRFDVVEVFMHRDGLMTIQHHRAAFTDG
jgi:putative endonuclease